MKETVTDYEVETKEVETTQYRCDFSGRVLDEDTMVTLAVTKEMSSIIDRANNPYGHSGVSYHNDDEPYYVYDEALTDVQQELDNSPLFRAEDILHVHIEEYAALKGVDADDIDADTDIPEVYAKTVKPEVVEKSWIDIDIKWTHKQDRQFITAISFLIMVSSVLTVVMNGSFGVVVLSFSLFVFFGMFFIFGLTELLFDM